MYQAIVFFRCSAASSRPDLARRRARAPSGAGRAHDTHDPRAHSARTTPAPMAITRAGHPEPPAAFARGRARHHAVPVSSRCCCPGWRFWRVGFGTRIARVLLAGSHSGDLKATGHRVDTLTHVMLVVVNTVSAFVHLYSIGYMEEDPHRPRFFAYLSLFTFAMLMLVTADNLVQLFFGWEGVGLASYLLIGFWYHKPEANAAAIKAFVVNRVGDFGFALGIFAVFMMTGAVDLDTVFAQAPSLTGKTINFFGWHADALTLICLLLFMGAMGKSAQFLLHTWLPDAMEGPTPVSALIHAATMVTAGVFMVARLSPLFELAPKAQAVVTLVGATTAFFAATVGLVQNDIKRVVAYSTCSQLGYMFVAMGVGAYSVGMFHLFTHAFFKALLFLGLRLGDPRDASRAGHAQHGRAARQAAGDLHLHAGRARSRFTGFRSPPAIIQGRDHRGRRCGAQSVRAYAFVMTWVAALLTRSIPGGSIHDLPRQPADRSATSARA
jgi:NADH-quinone oxidoreductase subunit L